MRRKDRTYSITLEVARIVSNVAGLIRPLEQPRNDLLARRSLPIAYDKYITWNDAHLNQIREKVRIDLPVAATRVPNDAYTHVALASAVEMNRSWRYEQNLYTALEGVDSRSYGRDFPDWLAYFMPVEGDEARYEKRIPEDKVYIQWARYPFSWEFINWLNAQELRRVLQQEGEHQIEGMKGDRFPEYLSFVAGLLRGKIMQKSSAVEMLEDSHTLIYRYGSGEKTDDVPRVNLNYSNLDVADGEPVFLTSQTGSWISQLSDTSANQSLVPLKVYSLEEKQRILNNVNKHRQVDDRLKYRFGFHLVQKIEREVRESLKEGKKGDTKPRRKDSFPESYQFIRKMAPGLLTGLFRDGALAVSKIIRPGVEEGSPEADYCIEAFKYRVWRDPRFKRSKDPMKIELTTIKNQRVIVYIPK